MQMMSKVGWNDTVFANKYSTMSYLCNYLYASYISHFTKTGLYESERKQIATCKPLSSKLASTKFPMKGISVVLGNDQHILLLDIEESSVPQDGWEPSSIKWLRGWPWEPFQWMHMNIMNQIWCTWHCCLGLSKHLKWFSVVDWFRI